ncbi:unnamed protein product [Vitrella brassicaformis CCMP3155]|uniref:U-box domain-containing protein n=2 Tax=Vitrella brassicaformis TaxID=1169539 RepID=A0A0G4ENT3_VITBC|nr:unnamed protein product [Vitrella brassicaformis CCMP3155]|eukprot:CEL98523.1 unnamed protein product [Vitrella brassicaformis CCMP3155]
MNMALFDFIVELIGGWSIPIFSALLLVGIVTACILLDNATAASVPSANTSALRHRCTETDTRGAAASAPKTTPSTAAAAASTPSSEVPREQREDSYVETVVFRPLMLKYDGGGLRQFDEQLVDYLHAKHLARTNMPEQFRAYVKAYTTIHDAAERHRRLVWLRPKIDAFEDLMITRAVQTLAACRDPPLVMILALRDNAITPTTYERLMAALAASNTPIRPQGGAASGQAPLEHSAMLLHILNKFSWEVVNYISHSHLGRMARTEDWIVPSECPSHRLLKDAYRKGGASSALADVDCFMPPDNCPYSVGDPLSRVTPFQSHTILGALLSASVLNSAPGAIRVFTAAAENLGGPTVQQVHLDECRRAVERVHEQEIVIRRFAPGLGRFRSLDHINECVESTFRQVESVLVCFIRPLWRSRRTQTAEASPEQSSGSASPKQALLAWAEGIVNATPVGATSGCLINVMCCLGGLLEDEISRAGGIDSVVERIDPLYCARTNGRLGASMGRDVLRLGDTVSYTQQRVNKDTRATTAAMRVLSVIDKQRPEAAAPSPLTELFFLALRALQAGYLTAWSDQAATVRVLHVEQQVAPNGGGLSGSAMRVFNLLGVYAHVLGAPYLLQKASVVVNLSMALILQTAYTNVSDQLPFRRVISPPPSADSPAPAPTHRPRLDDTSTPLPPPCPQMPMLYDALATQLTASEDIQQEEMAVIDESLQLLMDEDVQKRGPLELQLLPVWMVHDTLVAIRLILAEPGQGHAQSTATARLDRCLALDMIAVVVGSPEVFSKGAVQMQALLALDATWGAEAFSWRLVPVLLRLFSMTDGLEWDDSPPSHGMLQSMVREKLFRVVREMPKCRVGLRVAAEAYGDVFRIFLATVLHAAYSQLFWGLYGLAEVRRMEEEHPDMVQDVADLVGQLDEQDGDRLSLLPNGVLLLGHVAEVVCGDPMATAVMLRDSTPIAGMAGHQTTLLDLMTGLLNLTLSRLAGPQSLQLKVSNPRVYGFFKCEMLQWAIDMCGMIHDACTAGVCRTQDGGERPTLAAHTLLEKISSQENADFRIDSYEKAVRIVYRQNISTADRRAKFKAMFECLSRHLAHSRVLFELETEPDAPDEFLDALTSRVMGNPRRLPSSNIVDESSVLRLLAENNPRDPFSGLPLTPQDIGSVPELEDRLAAWRAAGCPPPATSPDTNQEWQPSPSPSTDTNHDQHHSSSSSSGQFNLILMCGEQRHRLSLEDGVQTTLEVLASRVRSAVGVSGGGGMRLIRHGMELPVGRQPMQPLSTWGVASGDTIQVMLV